MVDVKEANVFTTNEVAEILKVSIYTIYNLRRNGRLKGFTLSEKGNWRLTKEELDEFMKGD